MRGAVNSTSVYKGIPTTFTLRCGIAVPRNFNAFMGLESIYNISCISSNSLTIFYYE